MNPVIKHTHKLKTRIATASLLVAGLLSTQAHPGHTLHEEGVAHYVTSPYHLIALALIGLALCGAAFAVQRPVVRKVLATCGAVALLLAAVIWQMPS